MVFVITGAHNCCSVCSMDKLGVLLLPMNGTLTHHRSLTHCQVVLKICWYSFTLSWAEKATESKCLAQECNIIQLELKSSALTGHHAIHMMLIIIPVCPLGSIGCPPVPTNTHSSLLNKCFCPHPFDIMLPHLRVVSVVVTDSSLISFLLERWWSKLPSTYFSHTMKVCL